ncbi:hypothetical protein QQF64_018164 [Cirrhinus molitorella]|uniref:Uncharacterized protein n=1 Tax=Cirrhinus molitorella TaxID=172907 RepID=A0ABR3LN20_9TELE
MDEPSPNLSLDVDRLLKCYSDVSERANNMSDDRTLQPPGPVLTLSAKLKCPQESQNQFPFKTALKKERKKSF